MTNFSEMSDEELFAPFNALCDRVARLVKERDDIVPNTDTIRGIASGVATVRANPTLSEDDQIRMAIETSGLMSRWTAS